MIKDDVHRSFYHLHGSTYSQLMPNPQIPGFYYDECKKKYFRIVNGDQRINSAYHNNAIQAKARQKEFLSQAASKRRRQNFELALAKQAQNNYGDLDLSHKILQLKLGLLSPFIAFQSRLEFELANSGKEDLINKPVWKGLNETLAFIANGMSLELYYVTDLLGSPDPYPLCLGVHHISASTMYSDDVNDVQNNGEFVFCQSSTTYALIHWTCVRGRYRSRNLTAGLKEAIAVELTRTLFGLSQVRRFKALFHEKSLHLLCDVGLYFVFNLNLHSMEHFAQIPFDHFENYLQNGSVYVLGTMTFFNASKKLFFYDRSKKRFLKWNCQHVIYGFFAKTMVVTYVKKETSIIRFWVVSRASVQTVDFLHQGLRFSESSPAISLYNSNETQPLIQMIKDLLIIEETPKRVKVLNTETNSERTMSLRFSLASPRTQKPRMLYMRDVLLICQTKKTDRLQTNFHVNI